MATPNYGFEKRQKELAKKRKKEEKLKEKAARKHGAAQGESDTADPSDLPPDQEAPATGAAGDATDAPPST